MAVEAFKNASGRQKQQERRGICYALIKRYFIVSTALISINCYVFHLN
jgi:hypothetical protein